MTAPHQEAPVDVRTAPEPGSPEFAGSGEPLEALAEAVARRVVELLDERRAQPSPARRLLSAREVAEVLGRSVDWVREYRHELGVVAGRGARPRLLFDAAAVDRYATACDEVVRSQPDGASVHAAPRRERRPRTGTSVDLLPVGRPNVAREAA